MNGRRLLAHQRRLGAIVAAVGTIGLALLMARGGHTPWGVGWGIVLDLVVALGVLGVLGLLREYEPPALAPAGPPQSGAAPYRGEPGPGTPSPLAPSRLSPASLAWIVGGIVLLPALGFGLWDPWETHYAEVAREMLARDDWISLWWQDEWFWSKPILLFWMSGVSMALFGVRYGPDGAATAPSVSALLPPLLLLGAAAVFLTFRILSAARRQGWWAGVSRGGPLLVVGLLLRELWVCHREGTLIELAVRLPVVLGAIAALATVGWAIERVFGARAGRIAVLVLATMPYWALLAHQAMVDMPFVATLTIAMCLLLVAWKTEDHETIPTRGLRLGAVTLEVHALLGLVVVIVVLVLPQVVYLATRHVTIGRPWLSIHLDRFAAGSGGNETLRPGYPHLPYFLPIVQALLALGPAAWVLWRVRAERRLRPVAMLAFYVLSALSLMGKGLPGVLLPGLVALVALATTRRWQLLAELRIGAGVALVYSVAMPWYVAMFSRHGPRFTDRLLIHDHINRLTVGVHGDTGSVQYFLGQLGYGTFPWAGLAVLAVGTALVRPASERGPDPRGSRPGGQVHQNLLLWFVLSFALFSMMVTKFHHYVFPAVPPLAMLIAIALDRVVPAAEPDAPRPVLWMLGASSAIAIAVLVPTWMLATAGDARWHALERLPLAPGWVAFLILGAVAIALARRAGLVRGPDVPSERDPAVAAAFIGCALVLLCVTRDLADVASTARPKGTERLIHLFIYNYQRAWPPGFDASDAFGAFGAVATALTALAASVRLRRVALAGLLALSLGFVTWLLHGHMKPLTRHWSQQHLMRTYYESRGSADERLVAWQMNWKGENLYTGNRVLVYVSLDNTEFERWLGRHRGEVHWFVLERGRLATLRRLLDCDERSCPIIDDTSNKFVLLRSRL